MKYTDHTVDSTIALPAFIDMMEENVYASADLRSLDREKFRSLMEYMFCLYHQFYSEGRKVRFFLNIKDRGREEIKDITDIFRN